MNDVKESLQKANEEHEVVKGIADGIQKRSQISDDKYKKELEKFSKFSQIEGAAYVSTPILGQVASFAVCGYQAANETIEACTKITSANNIPVKMLAGGLAGAGGALMGLGASTILLPAFPFLWWRFLSGHVQSEYYKELTTQFQSIGSQMVEVERHLTVITEALSDIEKRLNTALRAENTAKRQNRDDSRERMVQRMKKRAEELIESCDSYFSNVQNDEPMAIDDSTAPSSSGKNKKKN